MASTYGAPRDVDPDVALMEEIHRTAGHVQWLGEQIAAMNASEFSSSPPMLLDVYQRERRHLAAVCRDALAVGIAERQVRLAEQQGQLLAAAVRMLLERLDLSPAQWAQVPTVVPQVLRSVAARQSGDAA